MSALGLLALGAAIVVVMVFAVIIWYLLLVIANWKIFSKAGQPGWMSIIPFLNGHVLWKIAWKPQMFWICLVCSMISSGLFRADGAGTNIVGVLFALITLILYVTFNCKLSRAYGLGGGFALGLVILNPIFLLILGYGNAEYEGPQ